MASQGRSEGGVPGNAQPVEVYAKAARELDAEAFTERFGNSFLLATATSQLGNAESSSTRLLLEGVDEDSGARTADVAVVIYALRTQGMGGHLVTIGRDKRHDVVIPDPSVSRFHAFAKRNEDGTCLIQDMQSTNGTTVNGASAPARGAGPPLPVKPGDTVRIGRVQFTFTNARALREFALQTGS